MGGCRKCAAEGKYCPGFQLSMTSSTFGSCVCGDGHKKIDHDDDDVGGNRCVSVKCKGTSGKVSQICNECDCTEFVPLAFGNKQKCEWLSYVVARFLQSWL